MQQKAATGMHSGGGFTFVERTQPKRDNSMNAFGAFYWS